MKQADILHNGTQVDFTIRFPGTDNVPVYLPIDPKFPGDSYEALVDALSSGSREDIDRCRKNLKLTESKLDSLIGTRTNAINRALRGITELSDDDLAGKLIDSVAKNSGDDV